MENQKSENNLNPNSNWWYLFCLWALLTGIVVILVIFVKADPEDLKDPTKSLALGFRTCFSFFAALSFWGLSTYVTQQTSKEEGIEEDPSPKYLTIAMAIFGLSSLLTLINLWCPFYEIIPIVKNQEGKGVSTLFGEAFFITFLAVLSIVNSRLILWAIIHIDLDKAYNGNYLIVNPVKRFYNDNISPNKKKWKTRALVFTRVVIAIEIVLGILYCFDELKSVKIIDFIDLLFSLFTCVLLGVVLFTAFILREMRKVAWLATLMTSITLVSQYYSYYDLELPNYFLALSYTTTFVMLLFSLEVSFFGEKIISVLRKVRKDLEIKIQELNQKSYALEIANAELKQKTEELAITNKELEQKSDALEIANAELKQKTEELAITNKELEQKSDELEHTNTELRQKTEELKSQKVQYERFVEVVGSVLKPDQAETYFNDIAQGLKGKLDYLLAIAVKSNIDDGNTAGSEKKSQTQDYKINYIFSKYKSGKDAINERNIHSPQGTFAGWCIENGKQVIVYDLNVKEQRSAFGVGVRNDSKGGKAKSLIFMPLMKYKKKKQGVQVECFGAITMQFKYTLNEDIINEKINLINSLAEIFSKCIDPKRYLTPKINFLKKMVNTMKNDDIYHEKFLNGKLYIKKHDEIQNSKIIEAYSEVASFIGWNQTTFDQKLDLIFKDDDGDYYLNSHPFNFLMKSITSGDDVFTCGMVLLLGIGAFEDKKNEVGANWENKFLTTWRKIIAEWKRKKNDGNTTSEIEISDIEMFFRGRHVHDSITPDEHKKIRLESFYKLFKCLVILKGSNRCNEIDIIYSTQEKYLEIRFNINDIKKLEEHIKASRKQIEAGTLPSHDLSREIVLLENLFPKEKFKCTPEPGNDNSGKLIIQVFNYN